MLKYIEETGKYVKITGFRAVGIKYTKEFLTAVRKQAPSGVWVQFLDADLVASWQHLFFAVLNALLAFRTNRNISKSVAVETLLYASAQRQISKAIQLIGVRSACANVAVVITGENPASVGAFLSVITKRVGKEPDETVLEVSIEKAREIRAAFGITEIALATVMTDDDGKQALVKLVIEKIALLSTRI